MRAYKGVSCWNARKPTSVQFCSREYKITDLGEGVFPGLKLPLEGGDRLLDVRHEWKIRWVGREQGVAHPRRVVERR
jgi:hypothetical protein